MSNTTTKTSNDIIMSTSDGRLYIKNSDLFRDVKFIDLVKKMMQSPIMKEEIEKNNKEKETQSNE